MKKITVATIFVLITVVLFTLVLTMNRESRQNVDDYNANIQNLSEYYGVSFDTNVGN